MQLTHISSYLTINLLPTNYIISNVLDFLSYTMQLAHISSYVTINLLPTNYIISNVLDFLS